MLDIAEQVRRHAAPGAWIIDFTNPVGIVTRQLLDAGHRAMGLCNVGIGFQRRIAAGFGVEPDRVRLGHAGLNHLSWIRSVRVDGVERLPELLTGDRLTSFAQEVDLPAELLSTLGAIPSYYLHYFYCTDQILARQRGGDVRAATVLDLERELLTLYQDPALDELPELLTRRGGAYYSEAAAALVTSLFTGDGGHHYVNVRNHGTIAGLADDDVVEVAATVDADGAHPLPVPPLPPEQLGLVQAVTGYEVLAGEAARTGSRGTALRALIANPLVRQWDAARDVLDALIDAHAPYLPRFTGPAR